MNPYQSRSQLSRNPSALPRRLLVVLVGLAVSAAVLAQSGQPEAVIAEPIHDFGEVARGDKVTHAFRLENRGTAPLEIREVRAPCACTVAHGGGTVPPGGSIDLEVELDTTSLLGASSKKVHVYTNDPASPRIDLTLKVLSQPLLFAKPGYVRYIVVQGFEQDSNITQKIWARQGADFEITRVESPSPHIEVAFRRATDEERGDAPGMVWLVTSKIDPWAPVGPLTGFINVYSGSDDAPALPLPVSGFMRPIFAISPSSANFGEIALGGEEPIQGSLKVQNFAEESIALTKLELDLQGITTELKTEVEGHLYYVTLRLDPEMAKGPFEGTLKIHTDSTKAPLLEVKISGNAS